VADLHDAKGNFTPLDSATLAAMSPDERARYQPVANLAETVRTLQVELCELEQRVQAASDELRSATEALSGPKMTVTDLAKQQIESNKRLRGL
jgi:hypothetical protein